MASDAPHGNFAGLPPIACRDAADENAKKTCIPKPSTTKCSKCKLYKRYVFVEAAVKSVYAYSIL